jgi:hypothetical protein
MGLNIFDLFLHFHRRPLVALEGDTVPMGPLEARASRRVRVSLPLSVSAPLLRASHKARPTPGLVQVAGGAMVSTITSKRQ